MLCPVKVLVALVVSSEKVPPALHHTVLNRTVWWIFKDRFLHFPTCQKKDLSGFFPWTSDKVWKWLQHWFGDYNDPVNLHNVTSARSGWTATAVTCQAHAGRGGERRAPARKAPHPPGQAAAPTCSPTPEHHRRRERGCRPLHHSCWQEEDQPLQGERAQADTCYSTALPGMRDPATSAESLEVLLCLKKC